MRKLPPGAPRLLSRQDVAMILELRSEGVRLADIAYYAYGITRDALYQRLKVMEAV